MPKNSRAWSRTLPWLMVLGLLAPASVVVACGDDDAKVPAANEDGGAEGEGGTPTEGDSDAVAYAKTLCAYYEACNTNLYRGQLGGTQESCLELVLPVTQASLDSDGNEVTRTGLDRCLDAIGPTCDRPIEALEECTFKGAHPNGHACSFAGQCSSGSCFQEPGESCGVCTAIAGAGESCESAECAAGLMCSGLKKCAEPAGENASCGDSTPCRRLLVCAQGVCTARGTLGASCDPAVGCVDGLDCADDGSGSGPTTCRPTIFAALGAPCGRVLGSTRETRCEGGSCARAQPGDAEGTCVAFLEPGATCAGGGPECAVFSSCIEGKCVARDLGCE